MGTSFMSRARSLEHRAGVWSSSACCVRSGQTVTPQPGVSGLASLQQPTTRRLPSARLSVAWRQRPVALIGVPEWPVMSSIFPCSLFRVGSRSREVPVCVCCPSQAGCGFSRVECPVCGRCLPPVGRVVGRYLLPPLGLLIHPVCGKSISLLTRFRLSNFHLWAILLVSSLKLCMTLNPEIVSFKKISILSSFSV